MLYYRFQPQDTIGDDRLGDLQSSQIWFSSPDKFNDPMDIKLEIENFSYRGPFSDEIRLRAAMKCLVENNVEVQDHWFYDSNFLSKINNWIENETILLSHVGLEDHIMRRFRSFGVACFSPIWNNQLMWAHYASSHQGFCIEYAVRNIGLAIHNAQFSQFNVNYTSELPSFCISEALFSPHQLINSALSTKHIDWAYEKEWRLIHFESTNTLIDIPKGMEISALIAGLNSTLDYQNKLKQKADSFNIPAFRIMRKDNSYDLEKVLIT